MPDNDLGTAHGRIRITYEGKGAEKANASVIEMSKRFEAMQKRLEAVEKQLAAANSELQKTNNTMERTSRKTRLLDGDVLRTARRFRAFRSDVRMLKDELVGLGRGIETARKGYNRLAFATRLFNTAGQYNSRQQLAIFRSLSIAAAEMAEKGSESYAKFGNAARGFTRNILRNEAALLGTRSVFTLFGTTLVNVRNRVLGVNNALAASPGWVQKLNVVTTTTKRMAAAFALLGVALGPFKLLQRIARTGIFTAFTRGVRGMAAATQVFGNVSERVFGRNIFGGLTRGLLRTEGNMKRFLEDSSKGFERLADRVNNTARNLLEFSNKSKSLIGGIALAVTGVNNLWQRFQWFFKLPKPLMAGMAVFFSRILPTALYATSKALVGASNAVAMLVDGAIQLSGALTVIPGIIAVIAAGFTALFPIFAGLKDQFKDVFSDDPTKAWEAMAKLPEHLRPIAQSIRAFIPRWKELQKNLQTFAFAGVDKQITKLGDSAFPILERGSLRVAGALRTAKDRLVEFLMQAKTQADIENIYGDTAQIGQNLANSLQPALASFRDLAAVGTQFLAVQSAWIPILSAQAQEWSRINRENGNFERWMTDAKQGTYDLVKGLWEGVKGAKTLLTVFATDRGENGLQRFADAMERLNKRIDESNATGFLARLRAGVQNMGEKKLEEVKEVFKILTDTLKSLAPLVQTVSDAFSSVFIPAAERAMWIVQQFVEALDATGLTHFIGWLLGAAGAVKLLPRVFATAIDAIKVFAGTFLVLMNKQKVIDGITGGFAALATRMEKMGGPAARVANGMMNVSGAIDKTASIISKMISGLTIAGTAFLVFFAAYSQNKDEVEAFDKQLKKNAESVKEFGNALRKSFIEDRTMVGKNVLDDVQKSIDDSMNNLQATVDKGPGFWSHINDFFVNGLDRQKTAGAPTGIMEIDAFFADSDALNQRQAEAAAADMARGKLQELKDAGVDLTKEISGSDSVFNQRIEQLKGQGEAGAEAIKVLQALRDQFTQVEKDMRVLGPAGAAVKDGLKQISEAAADASQKLDGLRLVLEGLGYLKTNTLRATAEYQDAIQTMADKVTEALTGIDDAGKAFDPSGNLDLMTKSGRALLDVLAPIGDRFQAMAANGGDATKMWQEMQPEIDATVDALNRAGVQINREQFVNFLQKSLGTAPIPIQIALQTGDNSQAAEVFKQFMLATQALADNGVFVPINFGTDHNAAIEFDKQLEAVLGHDITDVSGNNIVLKAGVQLQPDDLIQLQEKLKTLGFQFGPQGPNVTPTITPPQQAPPAPGQPPRPGQPPAPAPAAPAPPPVIGTPPIAPTPLPNQVPPTPTPQVIVGAPEVVSAALDQIKTKMDEIDKFNPTIDFNLDLTQTAIDRLNEVKTKIDEIKKNITDDKIVIDIQVLHVTESVYDLGRLQDKLNEVKGVVDGIAASFLAAFANAQTTVAGFLDGVQGKLDEFVAKGKDAGSKFVDALAQGLETNPAATQAAERMAQAIKDRFHQSPPKKGPLAAHGDAAKYAGGEFVSSYATGIAQSGAAVSAAEKMGQGATRGAMAGDKNYQAGQYLGQLSQLANFAAAAVDAFTKLANTVASAAKFASDPLGKGTFFGKRQGFVRDPRLSAEERQQRKEDAAQQRIFSFYGSGQRPDLYDPKTGRIRTGQPGTLSPDADPQSIANYITDKAMSLGYSREQANQFVVQAVGESGLSRTATSSNGLWKGIFQFDSPTWEGAGGGDINDPQKNIDNYFALAAQRGLTPENFLDPHQLGTQVSIGGPLNPKNVGHEATARANAQKFIDGYVEGVGQFVDGVAAGLPAAIGNLPQSKKLTTQPGLGAAPNMVASMLEAQFPGITSIGGKRDDPLPMHPAGRALDVGIGNNLALGDQIAAYIQANFQQLGIQSYIWRNIGRNLVANEGGGPGTTYSAGGHMDHVHVQFADGAKMDIAPDGTMNMNVPRNSPMADANYGLPPKPEDKPAAPRELVTRNPDGTFSVVHGTGDKPGPQEINPATGRPWTPEEAAEFWNRPENAMQYDNTQWRPGDQNVPGTFQGTEEQMLDALKQNNSELAKAIATAEDYNSSDEDAISALNLLAEESQRQKDLNTPESRARASQLDSVISGAASDRGLVEDQNPIDKATDIIGTASSIAGDIFQVVNSAIEAVGAAKNLGDTLVRGVENTEDIMNMIDQVQKFIQLGADIAGAVSSVAGAIGSVIPSEGTFGAGAAVSAVGQIAGIIQSALETVNAMIDLGQEAYRIIGSYVGDFLGILTGGAGGALEGNVKFLLDEANNQLLTYSADNPLDKRNFDGKGTDPNYRNQMIGNINVYGGPGQDPRDNTRQMMFQVKASTMNQAVGQ